MALDARYCTLRHLGDGAAGGVDLVEDRLLGGPPLALKRLRAASDPRVAATFAEEFAVLASLSLPGVARVVDLGVEPDAEGRLRPYFTREFVDGQPLDVELSGADPARITSAFVEVLRVVVPLHRAGVLHRDLKPANIILDTSGQPHLIDFGLARRATSTKHTAPAGTPGYMAPELFRGESASVASDIYALGATLWRLLTGRVPFEELGARGLDAKLREAGPSLPEAGQGGVRRAALAVCQAALCRDPRDRTPNASEFAVRLLGVLGRSGEMSALPFVPPRPEGRSDLVARLLTQLRHNRRQGVPHLCVIQGQRGMGKTTLLMELKWRLQLANLPVLHVRGQLAGPGARSALAYHAALLGSAGPAPGTDLSSLLAAGAAQGAWLVLVDDLHEADVELKAALLTALQASSDSGLQVVATSGPTLPRGVTPDLLFGLDPLDRGTVDMLAQRALGVVDTGVRDALFERCAGNPGLLVETLAALHGREGVAAVDVVETPVGQIGEHRARAVLARLDAVSQRALLAVALAGRALPEQCLRHLLGEQAEGTLERLAAEGLFEWGDEVLRLTDISLADYLRKHAGELGGPEMALRMLEAEAPECDAGVVARLSLWAGDEPRFAEVARRAAEEARTRGDLRGAAWLLSRLLQRQNQPALHASLVDLYEKLGEHGLALEHATAILQAPQVDAALRARAVLGAAHALLLDGRAEHAVERLRELPADAPAASRIDAQRELSRIHLRRDDRRAAEQAAEAGLAIDGQSSARSELLAIQGYFATLDGDSEVAAHRFAEAVREARQHESRRAESRAQVYAALAAERTGQLESARNAYRQCLVAAQADEDLEATATYALNLGNVSFRLSDLAAAQENYALAHRLARRTGQGATEVLACNNLATLHLYLGSFAQAESGITASLRVAENLGLAFGAAHARGILGDVSCRGGAFDTGVAHFQRAATELDGLGRHRELAEVCMEHASAVMDAERLDFGELVVTLLERAGAAVEASAADDFRTRLEWLRARAHVFAGRPEAAVETLDRLEQEIRDRGDRDLLWCVLATSADAQGRLGDAAGRATRLRAASQIIDALSNTLAVEHREAFRADPRRRKVLEASHSENTGTPVSVRGLGMSQTTVFGDSKHTRLLELIKRLAREHDVDALLDRITDAAVELSGAERGFVLLTNEQGELEQRSLSDRRTRADQRHAAFSQSIAEAVLIDGEPIVTFDAQGDARVNEFMSVHQLNLRSVACLPICGMERTVGVMYLEHRLRTGRFREQDIDLLHAFADQAAIAIENARLWNTAQARQQELEETNRRLEAAKRDVERVLAARSEELERVKQDLGASRQVGDLSTQRFGLVGRSEAMREVFALIERVQGTAVPVVIEGESGTGKELAARAIHNGSARKDATFVAVNCPALPESLLESELFGHVRGAFTGADRDRRGLIEEAHGGTLFLDEFADIPLRMQVGLLRVLQEGKLRPVGGTEERTVDVRVVVACNRDLAKLVAEGKVREDLFYRLSVVQVRMPALRERPEDIPLICDHLLTRIAKQQGQPERRLSASALRTLGLAELPGNVRQLEHLLLSASLMTDASVIEVDDLPLEGPVAPRHVRRSTLPPASAPPVAADEWRSAEDLDGYRDQEREIILGALRDSGWNRARAAQTIGMARRTFYRRLRQYGIQ